LDGLERGMRSGLLLEALVDRGLELWIVGFALEGMLSSSGAFERRGTVPPIPRPPELATDITSCHCC
jgi:hypothetical protein